MHFRSPTTQAGLRVVASFEAAKGVLVLVAGLGLLSLVHHDLQSVAERIVERFHLNPARKYPQIFIQAAGHIDDAHLMMLAALALVYATGRLIEAYGLWRARAWAEWLALVSGSIYFPIELYELDRKVTWVRASALVINLLIVVYMAYALWQRRGQQATEAEKH
ncbi:MAG: DUF2127 domain-containing protein [Planctomycetes bacterium]|nr:DUF2127 domain-containing protein [Planctomycetota bacterium]